MIQREIYFSNGNQEELRLDTFEVDTYSHLPRHIKI